MTAEADGDEKAREVGAFSRPSWAWTSIPEELGFQSTDELEPLEGVDRPGARGSGARDSVWRSGIAATTCSSRDSRGRIGRS